jgi:UDP-N-acetylglucosamine--N-acetylmuramyl-(pentapeptide) pyrophosphoryl-undecaprenol N-acetylglucosamine transferase
VKDCIVVTGGGTGGHVFPALAVVDELRALWPGRVVWIGSARGMERAVVGSRGLPFYGVPSGKLRRYLSLENLCDGFRVLAGLLASLVILIREKPRLVFSKGGYVSVPPLLAARLLGIPAVTHESDLEPGLATRINARFARRILVSFSETAACFEQALRARVVHTGNPVRAALLHGDAQLGRRLVGCPPGRPLLLVLGGSLGSAAINDLVAQSLETLLRACFVVHQMGPGLFRRLDRAGYYPAPFFGDELPHVLAAADLVVCRAGANTLWELAALGKPSILIPLSARASRGDQIGNAGHFADAGASLVLEETDAGTREAKQLGAAVLRLLGDRATLMQMGRKAAALGRPEAAIRIARLLLEEISAAPVAGRKPAADRAMRE